MAVDRWSDIWLNEGFATYAEWLWSEGECLGTAQETFDFSYDDFTPDDDPWWDITIGDPGPDLVFEYPVCCRGAMTPQALRLAVGDDDFFRILKRWARSRAGDNVSIPEFIRLAERVSGHRLDDLFDAWLLTPGKPALPGPAARSSARRVTATPDSARASLELARREGTPRR